MVRDADSDTRHESALEAPLGFSATPASVRLFQSFTLEPLRMTTAGHYY
ncbi:hypothetical protein PDE_00971 [Penicillium oxalicum 114-2]|uniref:Uncharacterized protein n=1 Tax=Penicillium oxalicum (strain 114-2 / CGMCC 5302) TaxID=933388 RepID=S7Z666_PENO1|nr:hypothetical protein PDE_00971 [Penicillium oxalicum 114-2]